MVALIIVAGVGVALVLAFVGKTQVDAAVTGVTNAVQSVTNTNPMATATPLDGDSDNIATDMTQWTQSGITTDPNTWPSGDAIWDICRAIAQAEGYNTNGAAFQLNNPGDLSPGDEHGYATAGAAEFHGGSNIIHFATAADGWNALYTKVSNIVTGKSKVYLQTWTIAQVASKWAGNSGAWAANVARVLNLDANTDTFAGYVNG
jgi:hypothetical protein